MEVLNQVVLHEKGRIGPNLEAWLAYVGGDGLEIALQDSAAIIPLIKKAGLRGLGGSGFPTHFKWSAVAEKKHSKEKYLICNGNEDEPGTFKDRVLLEETPHQLIEGAMIAAVATNITRIVFYINPDLESGIANIQRAIKQWKESELYAKVSAHLQQPLEMSILPTSGHYIGGEETAAIESVENKFPFPRRKPPFPADNGVHGCPTLIDNIETLCHIPHIVKNGPFSQVDPPILC